MGTLYLIRKLSIKLEATFFLAAVDVDILNMNASVSYKPLLVSGPLPLPPRSKRQNFPCQNYKTAMPFAGKMLSHERPAKRFFTDFIMV